MARTSSKKNRIKIDSILESPTKAKAAKTKTTRTNKKVEKKTANKRGRPRKENVEEVDVLEEVEFELEIHEEVEIEFTSNPNRKASSVIEQIMFKLPYVEEPLIGTPKEVQRELDSLANKMQSEPENFEIFDKIHLYMHGYLLNVVLKKFPYIRGMETVDIYQETLCALRNKAIPNFKKNKGMSFLNFAKMCIRRHLITLLHASHNRIKDKAINEAISLDSSPNQDDENGKNTYANIIADGNDDTSELIESQEAYKVTKNSLIDVLSDFEKVVLNEYLSSAPYKEISTNISKILNKRYDTKSVDNALLRIRKKAAGLKKFGKIEDIPLFM